MLSARLRSAAALLAAPVALAAIAIAQLWPGLGAGLAAPISWDHGAHLGKAMLTAELLPSLRAWCDLVESGVPLNTLYSVGGPLWVLLFRLPTTWLDWHQSYALAFAAFRVLVGLAPYRLARAAGASRVGALFAGVLALADTGDHSEGGWFYDVTYGVWPMSLSMCFFFFGVADLIEARDSERRALLPRAGLFFGAALVTHQMPLLALLSLLPVWLVTRWLDGRPRLAHDARAALGTAALGCAIASFWLLPMLLQSDWLSEHGQLYRSFDELGHGAARGEMVLRAGPWTAVLVAIAVLRALFVGGTRRFLAIAVVLMIVVSSRSWLLGLEALRFMPALGKLMFPRFLMIAKPMEFVLAGMMIGELAEPALDALKKALRSPRGVLGVAIAVLLVTPFAPGIADEIATRVVVRDVATTASVPLWDDFQDYAAWQRAQPADGFYRVAYHNVESHLFQGAPAYTGRPAHKIGMLIAETFGNTTESGDPAVLREMNVRYIVSVGAPPGGLGAQVQLVRSFGRIRVSELRDWEPSLVFDAGGEVRGEASAGAGHAAPRVVSLERARVVVEPAGARRIVVRRAAGPGWRADVDGRSTALGEWEVPGAAHLRYLAVDVPADARRLTLRHVEWQWFDVVGALLTWMGLLAALLVRWPALVPSIARRRVARIEERVRALPRRSLVIALAAVGALLLVLGVLSGVGTYRFQSHVLDARYAIETPGAQLIACDQPRPDGERGVACPIAPWLWLGRTVQAVDGRLRSCIWAHPPPQRQIGRVTFPRARLGSTLVVGGGVGDDAQGADGPPVVLRVRVDGQALGTIEAPWRSRWVERTFATPSGEHRVDFEVSAESDARRFFCFDAVSR